MEEYNGGFEQENDFAEEETDPEVNDSPGSEPMEEYDGGFEQEDDFSDNDCYIDEEEPGIIIHWQCWLRIYDCQDWGESAKSNGMDSDSEERWIYQLSWCNDMIECNEMTEDHVYRIPSSW